MDASYDGPIFMTQPTKVWRLLREADSRETAEGVGAGIMGARATIIGIKRKGGKGGGVEDEICQTKTA